MPAAPAAQSNGGGGSNAAPTEVQQSVFKPDAWTLGAVAGGHGGELDEAKTVVARLEQTVAEKVIAGTIHHDCVLTVLLGVACSGRARARWKGGGGCIISAGSSAGFVTHKGEGDGRCSYSEEKCLLFLRPVPMMQRFRSRFDCSTHTVE